MGEGTRSVGAGLDVGVPPSAWSAPPVAVADASGRLRRSRSVSLPRGRAATTPVRRFAAVGAVNTLLDYVLFIALTKLLRMPLEWVWVAKALSGTVAIANSFVLNRRWVFGSSGAPAGQAVKFVAVTVVAVYCIQTPLTHVFAQEAAAGRALHAALDALGLLLPGVLTEALAIKTIAFTLATSVSMTFNFVLYRLWVFPRDEVQ